jgi:hypothetical protein
MCLEAAFADRFEKCSGSDAVTDPNRAGAQSVVG